MLETLAATRILDTHERADTWRLRNAARRSPPVRSHPGWRHRVGWRLVEVGLRLVADAPPSRSC